VLAGGLLAAPGAAVAGTAKTAIHCHFNESLSVSGSGGFYTLSGYGPASFPGTVCTDGSNLYTVGVDGSYDGMVDAPQIGFLRLGLWLTGPSASYSVTLSGASTAGVFAITATNGANEIAGGGAVRLDMSPNCPALCGGGPRWVLQGEVDFAA
jgi:hypothetical protein